MIFLIAASLMWAASFGLIGRYLMGLDSAGVAFARLFISLVVFAPFIRGQRLPIRHILRLMAIGAVQYGVMYTAYIHAYRTLAGHEVALFTVLTPVFVTLFNDWRRGRFQRFFLLAAMLAVAGGAVLTWSVRVDAGALQGILLLQFANLCFAVGQVEYKLFMEQQLPETSGLGLEHFAFLYLGSVLVTGLYCWMSGTVGVFHPTLTQWIVLVYLGIVPSAIGFFCWNLGARRVNAGTLSVLNNAKIPLAMLISLTVFGEKANLLRLGIGVAGLAAGLIVAKMFCPGRAGEKESHEKSLVDPVDDKEN